MHSGILFSFKKKVNSDIYYIWMNLEDAILSKMNQSRKTNTLMIPLTMHLE